MTDEIRRQAEKEIREELPGGCTCVSCWRKRLIAERAKNIENEAYTNRVVAKLSSSLGELGKLKQQMCAECFVKWYSTTKTTGQDDSTPFNPLRANNRKD